MILFKQAFVYFSYLRLIMSYFATATDFVNSVYTHLITHSFTYLIKHPIIILDTHLFIPHFAHLFTYFI